MTLCVLRTVYSKYILEWERNHFQALKHKNMNLPWLIRANRDTFRSPTVPQLFAVFYPPDEDPSNNDTASKTRNFWDDVKAGWLQEMTSWCRYATGWPSRPCSLPSQAPTETDVQPVAQPRSGYRAPPVLPPNTMKLISKYLAVGIYHYISPRLLYACLEPPIRGFPSYTSEKLVLKSRPSGVSEWSKLLNDGSNGFSADGRIALLREELLVSSVRLVKEYFNRPNIKVLEDDQIELNFNFDWSTMTWDEALAVRDLVSATGEVFRWRYYLVIREMERCLEALRKLHLLLQDDYEPFMAGETSYRGNVHLARTVKVATHALFMSLSKAIQDAIFAWDTLDSACRI